MLKRLFYIVLREGGILKRNPIYLFCMVIFPLLMIAFFTTLMNQGQPVEMPIGVVDQDNSSVSRGMIRNLDGFQNSHVIAHYPNMNEAREAIQRNEIYAFLLIPKGTADDLLSSRQPKISFYYSNVVMLSGATLFKDLKTISALGSAEVAGTKLAALGKTSTEIKTMMQPIVTDLHMINNPWANYNIYLTTAMVPGLIMLFVFLITPYSIGTELKFKTAKEWLELAGNNIHVAIAGKLLPQTLIFLAIFYGFEFYIFDVLNFPHPGGAIPMIILGLLAVLACQGFGVFIFGLIPSLRMSMSVCSLWSVVGFSACGATFPIFAMSPMIEGIACMFPLRHFYMIYQIGIFNGFPFSYYWIYVVSLILFALLPIFSIRHIKTAMLKYNYIP